MENIVSNKINKRNDSKTIKRYTRNLLQKYVVLSCRNSTGTIKL